MLMEGYVEEKDPQVSALRGFSREITRQELWLELVLQEPPQLDRFWAPTVIFLVLGHFLAKGIVISVLPGLGYKNC